VPVEVVGVGAPNVEGVEEVVLPNEIGGLRRSAGLSTVDGVAPPPTFPNKAAFGGAGSAGVVENGLLDPDPKPPNAGLGEVLDNAPPEEFAELNGDDPPALGTLVRLNLNFEAAAVPVDDSAAGVGSEGFGTLKGNVDVVGFDGSGAGVELDGVT